MVEAAIYDMTHDIQARRVVSDAFATLTAT